MRIHRDEDSLIKIGHAPRRVVLLFELYPHIHISLRKAGTLWPVFVTRPMHRCITKPRKRIFIGHEDPRRGEESSFLPNFRNHVVANSATRTIKVQSHVQPNFVGWVESSRPTVTAWWVSKT